MQRKIDDISVDVEAAGSEWKAKDQEILPRGDLKDTDKKPQATTVYIKENSIRATVPQKRQITLLGVRIDGKRSSDVCLRHRLHNAEGGFCQLFTTLRSNGRKKLDAWRTATQSSAMHGMRGTSISRRILGNSNSGKRNT